MTSFFTDFFLISYTAWPKVEHFFQTQMYYFWVPYTGYLSRMSRQKNDTGNELPAELALAAAFLGLKFLEEEDKNFRHFLAIFAL